MSKLLSDNITVVLVALCGITSAAIWLFGSPQPHLQDSALANHSGPTEIDDIQLRRSPQKGSVIMPIADYNEILERPVFSPTRRPATEIAPADTEQFFQSPASQLADGEFKLVGIIIVDESRFALLQTAGTGQTKRVQIGETVDGWRISALSPSTATIERGSKTKTLELERKSDPQLAARAQANKRRGKLAARNAKKKMAAAAPADTPVTSNSVNDPQLPNDGDDE